MNIARQDTALHKKGHLLVIIGLLILVGTRVWAQDSEKNELRLLARPMPDSIMLRWAPTSYRLWLVGNKYGYMVTRTTLMEDGQLVEGREAVQLTPSPLKPAPLGEWEQQDNRGDRYAGIAAQSIYGDGFEVGPSTKKMGMLEIINKATEQENRYGFALFAADQSAAVAQLHGLMLVDRDVKKGYKYLYRVFAAQVPPGMEKDTAFFFTGVDEYLPLPKPMGLEAEPNDKFITLTWDNQYQVQYFNSFWIERSADGGKTFKRLNDVSAINATQEGKDEARFNYYLDTVPDNRVTYTYRVIGISPFGEESPPSEVVTGKGVNKITTVPRIVKKYSRTGHTVTLEWEFPNTSKEVVEGFRIFRSTEYARGYQLVADSLSVMQTTYEDKSPLMTGYYRMQAFNSDGGGGYSIPQMVQLVDSVPPVVPTGLTAVADTSGMVTVHWHPNPDADIFGYRVYRANDKREEFAAITPEPVKDTVFTDHITIKTLTPNVYYKIKAVDKVQNQSGFSQVFTCKRPDIVPPAAPLIRSVAPTDSCLAIRWANSPSPDVEKLLLYRNRSGAADWELVRVMPPDSTEQYNDVPRETGFTYRYILIAVDSTGNESKPLKPFSAVYSPVKGKKIWLEPRVKENKKEKAVQLSWEVPREAATRFLVYARKPGGQWQLVDGVDGNTFTYRSSFYYGKGLEFTVKVQYGD